MEELKEAAKKVSFLEGLLQYLAKIKYGYFSPNIVGRKKKVVNSVFSYF